ncbi:hypothetical protein CKAN_01669600 [Cinnamomum micranthum f. kanehirae]|uniref:Uncharacterized protein n=1 Tax=Cinnamomum micranthum f. kanehirae TaxID=337451 RepID=A0A443PAI2_9MAGN|nr:hypothetical protein CKAN_01669600 [Cinnamomum micranthum f. kanehirae]
MFPARVSFCGSLTPSARNPSPSFLLFFLHSRSCLRIPNARENAEDKPREEKKPRQRRKDRGEEIWIRRRSWPGPGDSILLYLDQEA